VLFSVLNDALEIICQLLLSALLGFAVALDFCLFKIFVGLFDGLVVDALDLLMVARADVVIGAPVGVGLPDGPSGDHAKDKFGPGEEETVFFVAYALLQCFFVLALKELFLFLGLLTEAVIGEALLFGEEGFLLLTPGGGLVGGVMERRADRMLQRFHGLP
jgi:hypothetical protein